MVEVMVDPSVVITSVNGRVVTADVWPPPTPVVPLLEAEPDPVEEEPVAVVLVAVPEAVAEVEESAPEIT